MRTSDCLRRYVAIATVLGLFSGWCPVTEAQPELNNLLQGVLHSILPSNSQPAPTYNGGLPNPPPYEQNPPPYQQASPSSPQPSTTYAPLGAPSTQDAPAAAYEQPSPAMPQQTGIEGGSQHRNKSEAALVQSMLNDLGYDAGAADGVWGPRSSRALENFQRDHGLAPDGAVSSAAEAAVRSVWFTRSHEPQGTPANTTQRSPAGQNPSFDCTAATSPSEQAICQSPLLSGLDRQIDALFKQDQSASSDPSRQLKIQRAWLRGRDACQADTECLKSMMQSRVEELSLAQPAPSEPTTVPPEPSGPTQPAIVAATTPPPAELDTVPLPSATPVAAVPTAAQSEARSVVGDWQGSYSCDSIQNNKFDLSITQNGKVLQGTFKFNVPSQANSSGSFSLIGNEPDPTGQFTLAPTAWINKPDGFEAVGVSGQLAANDLSMSGSLLGCGTSIFHADRADATAGLQQAAADVDNVPPPAPGGPLEGIWKGAITCPRGLPIDLVMQISEQGTAAAALVEETATDPRSGRTAREEVLYLSRAAGGNFPLKTSIILTPREVLMTPQAITLDPSGRSLGIALFARQCNATIAKVDSAFPSGFASIGASLVGDWATPSPATLRQQPTAEDMFMMTTSTLLEFRETGGLLYGQIRAFYPADRPATQQDRLVASLRPILATPNGRIGFIMTSRQIAEGAFDPTSPYGAPLFAHNLFLLVTPPAGGSATFEASASSDSGFLNLMPNLILQKRSGAAAKEIAVGGAAATALPAGLGGRIAAAQSLKEQCDVLADWGKLLLSRPDAETQSVDLLQRETLPLFEDRSFVPVFGLPYILTTSLQRRPILYLLESDCPALGVNLNHPDLVAPWVDVGSFGFSGVTTGLMDRHDALQRVAGIVQEMAALPATQSGADQLPGLDANAQPYVQKLDEAERAAYGTAVSGNRQRIANGIIRSRIAAIDQVPSTSQGISFLKNLTDDVQASALPDNEKKEAIDAAQSKAKGIVQSAIASANQNAQAPLTLEGLAKVTQSLRAVGILNAQLQAAMGIGADLDAAQPVISRRSQILADAGVRDAFAKAVLAAAQEGDNGVNAVAAEYLEPGELAGSAGDVFFSHAVDAALQEVKNQQQKAILARGGDAPLVATGQSQAGTATGEPSAEDMLNALQQITGGMDAGQNDLATRCANREFENDPGLALMCLGQMASGGPMQVQVDSFRKVDCQAADGAPGYVCDFSYTLNVQSGQNMGYMGDLLQSGGNCTGRFVPSGGAWTLEDRDCH